MQTIEPSFKHNINNMEKLHYVRPFHMIGRNLTPNPSNWRKVYNNSSNMNMPELNNCMQMEETNSARKNILTFGGKHYTIVSESNIPLPPNFDNAQMTTRAEREFVPNDRKDEVYWCRRLKNNESARKSRIKRKALEKFMEQKLFKLQKENMELKMELATLQQQVEKKPSKVLEIKHENVKEPTRMLSKNSEAEVTEHNCFEMRPETRLDIMSSRPGVHCPDTMSSGNSMGSESICSSLSECNEDSQDFRYPLDLSSNSSNQSSSLKGFYKSYNEENSTGMQSPNSVFVNKLPLKFRFKINEHSVFTG